VRAVYSAANPWHFRIQCYHLLILPLLIP
jgi:hypothetical protein